MNTDVNECRPDRLELQMIIEDPVLDVDGDLLTISSPQS